MRKKIGLVLFLVSIISILSIYIYDKLQNGSWYDPTLTNFIQYIFIWSVVLFILNLLSFKLDINKYKNWLGVSLIIMIISIYLAYKNGDGGQGFLSFDGELTTLWTAIPYSIISLIYFIVNFLKTRTK